jgi:hypothetical protein
MSSADDRNSSEPIALRLACALSVGEPCFHKYILWEMPFIPRVGDAIVVDDVSSHLMMNVWGITFNAVDDEIWLHVSFEGSDSEDSRDIDKFTSMLLESGWAIYENLWEKMSHE